MDKVFDYVKELDIEFKNQLELFKKKNSDYGNAFEKQGIIGILIRMSDKINRLLSISKNKIVLIKDESFVDTLRDLSVYTNLALCLNKKQGD